MDSELSWRIPTGGDPRLLRISLAQVGLASIVAALIVLVAVPREWVVPALVGLIPLAVFMAYRRWHAYQQSTVGANNVRIDDAGLHWIDPSGQERSFRREDITAYSIGHDAETLRRVPSLSLILTTGFESQPIELHEPATPQNVRAVLTGHWKLAEQDRSNQQEPLGYDVALCIYSECHDDYQEWHWEGTKEELTRFFSLLAAVADELPLPPPGAKPLQRVVVANRRQPSRIYVAHTAVCHFEPDLLAAPRATLREIATSATEALADVSEPGDAKFNVSVGAGRLWTFHLHATGKFAFPLPITVLEPPPIV